MLLQPQRLAVQGAVEVLELEAQAGGLGVVLAPALRHAARELVAEYSQPLGAEEAAAHEVEQLVEDHFLLDLKGAGVAGDLAGDRPRLASKRQRYQLALRWWLPSIRRPQSAQRTRPRST